MAGEQYLGVVPDDGGAVATDAPSNLVPQLTDQGLVDRPQEEPPSFLTTAWQRITDVPTKMFRAFEGLDPQTGQPLAKYPDRPNLFTATGGFSALENEAPIPIPSLPGEAHAAALSRLQARQDVLSGIASGARPDQIKTLLMRAYPNQVFDVEKGHPHYDPNHPQVLYQGQPYYVAKPGADWQDAITLLGKGTLAAGYGKAAARALPELAAPGAVKAVAQAGMQALGQGAAEATSGAVPLALGAGGWGTTPQEILLAAGLGGAGSLTGRIGLSLWRNWRGTGQMIRSGLDAADTDPATWEMLSKTGSEIFRREGIDPTQMTVGQIRQANAITNNMADTLLAQQKGKPPGATTSAGTILRAVKQDIPLTAGQYSADPGAQFAESVIRGGGGRDVMTAFDQQQRARLIARAQTVAGGSETEEQLGGRIGQHVQAAGDKLEQVSKNAWARFPRLTPEGEANLPNPIVFPKQVGADLRVALEDTKNAISPDSMPFAVKGDKIMDDLTGKAFNLGEAVFARRDLGALLDQAKPGTAEYRVLTQMKRKLDAAIDNATAAGNVSGDPQRVAWWREANRAYTELRDFWAPDNPRAKQFMQALEKGGIEGQQVYDALWQSAQLDGGGPARDIIAHLTKQTGANSALLEDVRQSAMRNILLGRSGNAYEMNPQRFIDRVNRAMDGRGEAIWRQLGLPVEDVKQLAYLEQALQDAQNPNRSATATTLLATMQRFMQRYPLIVGKLKDTLVNPNQIQRHQAEIVTGMGAREGGTLTAKQFTGTSGPRLQAPLPILGGGLLGGAGDQR